MTTFFERNKTNIQCTAAAFLGGLAIGAILMYTQQGGGKRKLKFSDLYPETKTPKRTTPRSTRGTPSTLHSLYKRYKRKYT